MTQYSDSDGDEKNQLAENVQDPPPLSTETAANVPVQQPPAPRPGVHIASAAAPDVSPSQTLQVPSAAPTATTFVVNSI
jgi:hypothetical protein